MTDLSTEKLKDKICIDCGRVMKCMPSYWGDVLIYSDDSAPEGENGWFFINNIEQCWKCRNDS